MALPEMNTLPALTDVSAEQLREIIQDAPYFGAAQFLLAKKLYETRQEGYSNAIQQAALHFSNELWLNYNLLAEETNVVSEKISIENKIPETEYIQQEKPGTFSTIETEEEYDDEVEDDVEDIEDVAVNEKLSSLLRQQAALLETPVEPAAEIPLENVAPHRIDYFESQGIKLEEDKNTDKLGAQLKRFTDWLKQMKRVNPNQVELKTDEAGESQVQNIAQHSNETQEVVTETMAEVLAKQGKLEQAIEIYEKLSFNNPSKSVYFAAKIEELKG
jgi:tetratricopeptide (TPR) repeat protein